MAGGLLCRNPQAAVPYHISSVGLNLYSAEELCYFISRNLPLADETLINESLADWLGAQCGLKNTAAEMKEIFREAADPIPECLSVLFRESGYFSQNELNALFAAMKSLADLQESKRAKMQADVLMDRGKYQKAIDYYEDILRSEKKSGIDKNFTGLVYFNAGCAYERLFYTEKAEEYFLKAYSLLMDRLSMLAVLSAAYLNGGEEAMKKRADELHAHATLVEDVLESIRELPEPEYPGNLEKAVDEWIAGYHYATDL